MKPYLPAVWTNRSDHTALGSFTSEASLLQGTNQQPWFPAGWFDGPGGVGKGFEFEATGVLGSTGTPTYTFTVRLGSTVAVITDAALAVSAALTTESGVTNKWWRLFLRAICRTPGQAAGNTTFSVDGYVESPGGLASPFKYPLEPTTPDTATWTVAPANFDAKVVNYLQLSVACSASNAANAITCKNASVRYLG